MRQTKSEMYNVVLISLLSLLSLLLFLRMILLGRIHDTTDDPEDNVRSKES